MKITVAICTWNRAELLDRTLGEMIGLRVPEGVEWELLVVDNNSTDDTENVVVGFEGRLPVRHVFEPRAGKSHAANTVLREARGDLIVWTDDDVLVDAGWLEAYAQAARDWPDAALFIGNIEPWFAETPPAWVCRHLKELHPVYALAMNGPEVRPMQPGENLIGANMAFRASSLKGFTFNTSLGPRPGSMIRGEDDELGERIRNHDLVGVWVGSAKVRHHIPAERLTAGYVRRWHVGIGETYLRKNGIVYEGRRLFGAPRWLYREYVQLMLVSLCLSPFRGPRWFHAFRRSAMLKGMILESRRQGPQRLQGTTAHVAN